MRRRQNNPILTGEAGVGKTAVVEGFALRIATGDVPPPLQGRDRCARSTSGLLQAGASMKGEFENRLRQVIDEVQSSPKPIILFIDEAHTLIGAGGAAGTGDAANLLKPALARGTLRTIAATTWAEYKKHIEKDPALTRRFQVVQVDEPTEDKAILHDARHRRRRWRSTTACRSSTRRSRRRCKLSHRYIPARQLPDKSVSLLDTACARVAVSQHAVPADGGGLPPPHRGAGDRAGDHRARAGGRHRDAGDARLRRSDALRDARQAALAELEARWKAEKALVDKILEPRDAARDAAPSRARAGKPDAGRCATHRRRRPRSAMLDEAAARCRRSSRRCQGEHAADPAERRRAGGRRGRRDWTGIPVGRMVKDEIETVLKLADTLGQRVIGQDHALEMIARRIQTSRAGLENPTKPIGVFMLCRPVGRRQDRDGAGAGRGAVWRRAEPDHDQHERVPGGAHRLDAEGRAARLRRLRRGRRADRGGAAPAVRVVLLDEVEKAHPDVHEIFFQVFDKGVHGGRRGSARSTSRTR